MGDLMSLYWSGASEEKTSALQVPILHISIFSISGRKWYNENSSTCKLVDPNIRRPNIL
jgi:hypothetical protein